MKKAIMIILAALLAMPSFAQFENFRTVKKRNRFNHNNTEQYYGLRLGLNIASIGSDDVSHDTDSRTGLAFGAVYGFQLADNTPIWLEAGLLYSEKGGKTTLTDTGIHGNYKVTYSLNYLQLPIVAKYSFNVADEFYIDPFLGGYLALGVTGKTKDYQHQDSHSVYNDFSRFDGGLRVGCGAEYQMLYAEVGFDFGLANVSKHDFESAHTRNLFINVGVNF